MEDKLRSSLCCCFPQLIEQQDDEKPIIRSSSSSWSHELPQLKDKCRNMFSRIGKGRRRCSADFSYDPLSYALNFDKEVHDDENDFPDFSSRLPA